MSRNFSVGSVIDKNKVSSDTPWVILLDIFVVDPNTRTTVETVRLVANTDPVTYDGNLYTPANFEIRVEQKQNSDQRVSISAQDQNRLLQSRIEAYAGGIFSEVNMIIMNTDRLDQPAEMSQRFQITRASSKDDIVQIELGSENRLAIQFPKHNQWQDRCAWRFRGYGCAYSGPELTCDYSKDGPNGCAAKNNTINFRALPGLVRLNI